MRTHPMLLAVYGIFSIGWLFVGSVVYVLYDKLELGVWVWVIFSLFSIAYLGVAIGIVWFYSEVISGLRG